MKATYSTTSVLAIQFVNDPDTIKGIVDFVEGSNHEIEPRESGPNKVFMWNTLGVVGRLWTGEINEGAWLVKRNGKVVKLSDRDFQILFGKR